MCAPARAQREQGWLASEPAVVAVLLCIKGAGSRP
jgi:hypothetical protein